jgi:hypothetical protein
MDAFTFPLNTPGATDFKFLGAVDNVGGHVADCVAMHNGFAGVDLRAARAYLRIRDNLLI